MRKMTELYVHRRTGEITKVPNDDSYVTRGWRFAREVRQLVLQRKYSEACAVANAGLDLHCYRESGLPFSDAKEVVE